MSKTIVQHLFINDGKFVNCYGLRGAIVVELRPIAKPLILGNIKEIRGNSGGIKGKLRGN